MGCEVVISEVCCKVLSKARVPGMLLKVSVSLDYMAPLDPTFVLILAVTGLLIILSNNQDIARLFFPCCVFTVCSTDLRKEGLLIIYFTFLARSF